MIVARNARSRRRPTPRSAGRAIRACLSELAFGTGTRSRKTRPECRFNRQPSRAPGPLPFRIFPLSGKKFRYLNPPTIANRKPVITQPRNFSPDYTPNTGALMALRPHAPTRPGLRRFPRCHCSRTRHRGNRRGPRGLGNKTAMGPQSRSAVAWAGRRTTTRQARITSKIRLQTAPGRVFHTPARQKPGAPMMDPSCPTSQARIQCPRSAVRFRVAPCHPHDRSGPFHAPHGHQRTGTAAKPPLTLVPISDSFAYACLMSYAGCLTSDMRQHDIRRTIS